MSFPKCWRSVVLLCLMAVCLWCAVGSTIAWFTDEVTSPTNRVSSGKLDVEMSYSQTMEADSWQSVGEATALFSPDARWEPGHTEVVYLRIENAGSLALKYRLSVLPAAITPGATAQDAPVDLSEHLRFGIVQCSAPFESRTAARQATEAAFPLGGEGAYGQLTEQGESSTVALVVWMPETVGNEANCRPDKPAHITLGVALDATQLSFESDAFGPGYDQGAPLPEMQQAVYFPSLTAAFAAVNDGSAFESSLRCDAGEAVVSVTRDASGWQLSLMGPATETAALPVEAAITLRLNGHTVSFTETETGFLLPADASGSLTLLGSTAGSGVRMTGAEGKSTTLLKVLGGSCSVVGGSYTAIADDTGSQNSPNPCMLVSGNASLTLTDAEVTIADTGKGTPNAVLVQAGGKAELLRTVLTASAPYGLDVNALQNRGSTVASASEFRALSNYTAKNNTYASHSRGVLNSGALTLYDCSVLGTHAGLVSNGSLRIDGGCYEGYGHGGIYFSGTNTRAYVRNATIRQCAMPDGYYDDGIAGCNDAGFYIGSSGQNGNHAYLDSCTIYGRLQSFVVRGSSGEKDNRVFISHSTINTAARIRVDAGNTLVIGTGNNFTAGNTRGYGSVEASQADYSTVIEEAFAAGQ